jgi:GTP-binding protein EngB required for normal cell division
VSGPPGAARAKDLHELLRRCHRAELVALAELLRVRHQDLGLASLAARLDHVLRQRGGHELANVFTRGGEGPPWGNIVAGLAREAGLEPGTDVEANELALLEAWSRRGWEAATPAQREAAWVDLGLAPPVPDEAGSALAHARSGAAPVGFALSTVSRYAGPAAILALTPVGPLAGCAALLWLGRPRRGEVLAAVLEVARLRQLTRHRITVGVVGSPSSGKDAAIKAIFGIDSGNISPIAGSTREVAITRLPGPTPLFVVNTPGLGDVVEAVSEHARQVLELVDVFVYVVNAQGGVQQRERADYEACVARGRPVLAVVNKVDTLRESDRQRYLDDARAKLEAPADAFLAAAFDPLPQLAEAPLGVDAVRAWLRDALIAMGKTPEDVAAALSPS